MNPYSLYSYSFDGEALGGQIIVVAESREEADELAREELEAEYSTLKDPVKSLDLEFVNVVPLTIPSVVYYDDGDY